MSDSDEEGESGEGVSMTGFLFGNIDLKTGQLEDDILDAESKRQLSALQKLGLGSMVSAVIDEDEDDQSTSGGVSSSSAAGSKAPKKPEKLRRLISAYDSSDDSDDDDDDENEEKDQDKAEGNSNSNKATDYEDYDEEKSPSAIDFSDINELAEEDISSAAAIIMCKSVKGSEDEEDDYDQMPGKHVRRLFNEPTNEKDLMPPPSTTHVKKAPGPVETSNKDALSTSTGKGEKADSSDKSSPDKKLETPLAAMMPSKYAGVDVSEIFPDFRAGKVLRFSRLFGPGKPSSLPQIWKNVKRRRRKRKILAEGQAAADAAEEQDRERRGWDFQHADDIKPEHLHLDDDEYFLDKDNQAKPKGDQYSKNDRGDGRSSNSYPSIWRHGPAQLWYDMLLVPEDGEHFDYGFQIKPKEHSQMEDTSSSEDEFYDEKENKKRKNGDAKTGLECYPDETFHMVTQRDWESDIIWDGNDSKYKKSAKNKAAGWVPSGVNRTAQNFSQPGAKNSPGGSGSGGGSSSSSVTSSPVREKGSGGSSAQSKAAAKAAALLKASEEGGQVDDTWYSIFPVETAELVYGRWEDEVIWDVEQMEHIPEPKILALDPNDENIVLCIADDVDPNAAQGAIAPVKVKIPHPHVKKSKILLGKAGVINVIQEDSPPPSPKNDDKDPYNISNDEYYQPKYTEQSLLKISASGNIIQHSTPVVELRAPFIPTHMGQQRLRAFHRPAMRRLNSGALAHPGPHPILPLSKHIRKKAKQREQERLAAGGGDIFFMRTPEDLTGKDGELMLIEYCEEHPPLLSQVGMCSRIKNYYKRQAGKDKGPPNLPYGEVVYAHSSPFLGVMLSGSTVQALENNMYRAPIFPHPTPFTDFLIIRTRSNYFIREIDSLFTAGQECPLYEVPGPNSKRANNFVRDFLQVFIYRLFWKSRDNPRRIRMEEIKRAFPMHSESSIRKRLKLCADFKRTGADSNWWVIKPEFRLPTEEEIRAMVSPEQCCAYFSLIAAEQRLKDAGYGEKFLFAPQEDDDDENQNKIDDEVKTAPWNTTRAYIQAMKQKCLLQLTGPADPTGCGEGFSYIRVPNKPQTNKEEQEAQPKRIVTGTDADLRRLSLNNAKALLRKFDVPEEEIKKLSRWEVIDVVRTLSTEKAKAGEKGMTKFSRGNRFSVAEHQERYKEECQRIYELQIKVLSSSEVLSTDDDESSDSELSDIEEMGKNIETIICNKKTNTQVNQEKEEQERRELQKMILGETGGKDDDDKSPRKKRKEEEENQTLSGLVNHPGRVLKIHRTFKTPDGKEYTRTEIVRKAAIIDIYMRIRTTKDENFIRQFALLDDQAKEEMKKEKRRIQEQLRRIKRNQEKDTWKPSPSPRKKKVKLKPDLKMKCGACGQVGHMRTNKACPLYNSSSTSPPMPSMNVAMTQDEEEDLEKSVTFEDEELVRVDGTKLQMSGKVVKHAEDIKRRSLVLKVPKDAMNSPSARGRKKRLGSTPHCDYLAKKGKTTNRRRIDPLVVISGIFEEILNQLRDMPDSSQFHFPVSLKVFPDYVDRVQRPMDLRTIREKIRQKKYAMTSDFLADVNLIYENSLTYNGSPHLITEFAHNMLNLCRNLLKEKGDQLGKLERMINPLLDDDQTGLAYILRQLFAKLKQTPDEVFPFLKPVNKKLVKDYYDVIKRPMDLETMEKKNDANKYENRQEVIADLELIWANAKQYNGADSVFSQKAFRLIQHAKEFLSQFDEQLTSLEANIEKSKSKIFEEFGDAGDYGETQSTEQEQYITDSEDDNDMELVEPVTSTSPFEGNSPRNIHDDLEVSDSEGSKADSDSEMMDVHEDDDHHQSHESQGYNQLQSHYQDQHVMQAYIPTHEGQEDNNSHDPLHQQELLEQSMEEEEAPPPQDDEDMNQRRLRMAYLRDAYLQQAFLMLSESDSSASSDSIESDSTESESCSTFSSDSSSDSFILHLCPSVYF